MSDILVNNIYILKILGHLAHYYQVCNNAISERYCLATLQAIWYTVRLGKPRLKCPLDHESHCLSSGQVLSFSLVYFTERWLLGLNVGTLILEALKELLKVQSKVQQISHRSLLSLLLFS